MGRCVALSGPDSTSDVQRAFMRAASLGWWWALAGCSQAGSDAAAGAPDGRLPSSWLLLPACDPSDCWDRRAGAGTPTEGVGGRLPRPARGADMVRC